MHGQQNIKFGTGNNAVTYIAFHSGNEKNSPQFLRQIFQEVPHGSPVVSRTAVMRSSGV